MNRVVIVVADKFCSVDGAGYTGVDMSSVGLEIHAVQWFGTQGWIEYKPVDFVQPPNENITNMDRFEGVLASWESIDYQRKHPAPPPPPTAEQNKMVAESKLAATDWAVLPDVNITNKDEFIAYRAKIRDYVLNPVAGEIDWPVEPKAVWSV